MSLDRRVPEQDSAQNEELTRRAKEKRDKENYDAAVKENERQNAEIDKQNVLIEKTNAEAEAKYQADVLAYNKEQTRVEDGRKEVNLTFDKKESVLSLQYQTAVNAVDDRRPEVDKRYGVYSDADKRELDRAGVQYSALSTYNTQERVRALNQYEFKMTYPNAVLDQQISQAFKSSDYNTSLTGIYEKYQSSYAAQAERSRQNALQNAGLIHSGVKQTRAQSKIPYVQPPQTSKSPIYSVEQAKRLTPQQVEANLLSIISPVAPKAIRESSVYVIQKQPVPEHLTGVNTGQYIDKLNRPQTNIVSNPRALVAGLRKESIPDPVKTKPPTEIGWKHLDQKPILTGTGKGTLKDPYKSNQPNYNKVSPFIRTQWIVSDVMTGKIKTDRSGNTILFDTKKNAEKFSGIVNRKYQSNIGYDPTGKPIQGPVQTLFTVENVNPKTKGKYPTITFKSEGQANKYLERTAKSEPVTGLVGNDFYDKNEYVATKPSIVEQVTAPKPTELNQSIESSYNALDDLQKSSEKKNPGDSTVSMFNTVLEGGKLGLGISASLINFGEQVANPILFKEAPYLFVSKPPTIPPKEIILQSSDASETLIPIDISKSIESKNILFKDNYISGLGEYREKYSGGALVVGAASFWVGTGVIKSGANIGLRTVSFLKTPGKQAVKNELVIAANTNKGAIFRNWDVKQKGGIKTWDQLQKGEKGEKIGNRQPAGQPKLEPNPFGKERKIPYAINQAKEKIQGGFQTIQTEGRKAVQSGIQTVKTKTNQITTGMRQQVQVYNILHPNPVLIQVKQGIKSVKSTFTGLGAVYDTTGLRTGSSGVKKGNNKIGLLDQTDVVIRTKINQGKQLVNQGKQSIKNTFTGLGAVYDTTGLRTGSSGVKKTVRKSTNTPGLTLFHGTSLDAAKNIIKKGFSNKSIGNQKVKVKGTYLTASKNFAESFGTVLNVVLKKSAKITSFREMSGNGKTLTLKEGVAKARKKGFDVISGVENGNPVSIVLNKKAIFSIKSINGGKMYRNISNLEKTKGGLRTVKDNLSISLYKTKQSIKDTWARMGAVYDTTGTIKPVVKKTKKKPNILSKAQADFNANLNKQKKKVDMFITKRKDILDAKLSTVKNKLDVKQKLKNIKTQKQLADYFAEQDRVKNLDVKKAKTGPEIITPKSENELGNIGRKKGVTGSISDFFSKVKPFQQKLNLKGLYTTNQGSIGRVQGKTSRGAFADLLNEGINRVSPIQRFFRQSFKPNKSFGMVSQNKQKIKLFEDLKKIQKKGDKFTQTQKKERSSAISSKPDLGVSKTTTGSFGGLYFRRKEFFKQDILGDLLGKSRRTERLRENVFEMGKQGKLVISNFVKRGKILGVKADLPVSKFPSSQDVKTQNMLKDIGKTNRAGLDFVAYQKKSFDARKSSFTSPDTNLEILKSEINKLDLKQGGIKRLQRATRNLIRQGKLKLNWRNKINLPDNMTKMQYKNEGLYKALESESTGKNPIIEGLKTEKSPSTRIIWRLNESDVAEAKFTKSRLKDNEKYRAIGITVGAGTLGLVATSQTQEASAFPMPTGVLKQVVRSGGQELVFAERPQFKTIPTGLTKSILSSPQKSKEETEPKYKTKTLSKLGTMSLIIPKIIQSQPQKIKQTTRQVLLSPQKLNVDVKPKQETKQKTKQKLVQTPRYVQVFVLRQVPRLAQTQKLAQSLKLSAPLAPKQPQRLAQTPKLTPIPKIKLITRPRPPKKPPRMIIPFGLPKEEKKRETTKSLPGDKADFLGNTSETQVAGLFNRSETTYGLKKISRLRRGDKRELAGRSRSAPRREAKFVEGRRKDPFGFKDNTKKGKKFRISF